LLSDRGALAGDNVWILFNPGAGGERTGKALAAKGGHAAVKRREKSVLWDCGSLTRARDVG